MTRFSGFKKASRKLSQLSSKFFEAASRITESVDNASEETAEEVADTATRLAPRSRGRTPRDVARRAASDARLDVSERSGALKRSITYMQLDDGTYVIGSPLDYAEWVERGRGPVVAKDADALKFTIGGDTIFRKSVGPAEPQPFLRPALVRHRDTYIGNLEDEIDIMFGDVFD